MQWQGDDAVGVQRPDMSGELLAEPVGERKLMAIFEGVNQAIEGKGVTKGCMCLIEMHRLPEAAAAALIVGCRCGTLWTTRRRQCGQIVAAMRTKKLSAVGPAQDAGLGEGTVKGAATDCR